MKTNREIIAQIHRINSHYIKKNFTKNYSERFFTQLFNKELIVYLLKGMKVIAFAVGYKFKELPGGLNLAIIAVEPHHLHRGYGRKVLRKFINKFRNKKIYLNVKASNIRAINFYKANGFKFISSSGKVNQKELLMQR